MKQIGFIALIFLSLISCKKEEVSGNKGCVTPATVLDLTGLDGCGFVFELEDGTRLEPLRLYYCGTPPLSKEITGDPLYAFTFEAGKKVKIGYDLLDSPSICMGGPTVKITCIEEIRPSIKN